MGDLQMTILLLKDTSIKVLATKKKKLHASTVILRDTVYLTVGHVVTVYGVICHSKTCY